MLLINWGLCCSSIKVDVAHQLGSMLLINWGLCCSSIGVYVAHQLIYVANHFCFLCCMFMFSCFCLSSSCEKNHSWNNFKIKYSDLKKRQNLYHKRQIYDRSLSWLYMTTKPPFMAKLCTRTLSYGMLIVGFTENICQWKMCFIRKVRVRVYVAHQLGSMLLINWSMLLIILVFCVVCLCFLDFVCLRPVSCVRCNITSFSGMSIFDWHFDLL
jgi:hypothetical protein